MDTIFPTAIGYQGLFVVSYRKMPTAAAQLQRTGTVLLKRTYTITPSSADPAAGSVAPTAALPIFLQDLPGTLGNALLYEHDLAAFKPEGDVLVLGFTTGGGPSTVRVANQTWFSRNVAAADPDLFGWQPRDQNPRLCEGAFPPNDSDYPLGSPLPGGFNNLYYNGYRRDARQVAAVPYVPAAAAILLTRAGTSYGFTLGDEMIGAQVFFYPGTGPDEACNWRRHTIPMPLDTLVIEPEHNRCYTLWRGVWGLDELITDPGAYRRLVVTAQE
jgi:hypothetical protein